MPRVGAARLGSGPCRGTWPGRGHVAVVPGHVAEPGGWVRLWLRVEIPLLQPLLLAVMGTDLRTPHRPGRAPRSLGFHWARFNRGKMLHAVVCVYKRAHDLRKSPAFLFWRC